MYHLDTFEDICATTRVQGVPDEVIKSRLFTFSLCDKAHRWLKSLDPRTIQTWEQCKAAFLEQYFTQSRTSQLRNKISSFRQSGTESFGEAWERYKEYFRECPHHGFNQSCLLNTFYRGVDERYKMALDAASNGNFATNTEEEALIKIENLASSDNNHIPDYDRSARTTSTDSRRMEELMAKMEQLVKRGSKTVSFCDEQKNEDEEEVFQTELNYINGQQPFNRGFNNSYRNNNLSYRSNNVENPQDQYYPPQQRNQGYQQPFAQKQSNFSQGSQQRQGQATGSNQQSQVDELKEMIQQFMGKVSSQMAEVRQIFSKSQRDIDERVSQLQSHVREVECNVARSASNSQRTMGTLPGKPDQNPRDSGKEYCNQAEEQLFGVDVSSSTPRSLRNHTAYLPPRQGETERRKITPEVVHRTINQLKSRINDKEIENEVARNWEVVVDLVCGEIDEEKAAALIRMSYYESQQKHRAKLSVDPGAFSIPVILKGEEMTGICDLGSSVNVMTERTLENVDPDYITKKQHTIVLADGRATRSLGMAKNVTVLVGDLKIPADFIILRYDEEPKDPLILGRPFLKSGGALIDTLDDTIKF